MPAARSVASVRGMPRPGDTAAASAKVASTNIGRAAFVIVSPCGLPHRGQLVKTRRVRRHAEGVTAANLSGVLPVPEIAQNTGLREAEFGPLNPDVLVALSKIEYAQVLGAGIRAVGDPDSLLAAGKQLAAVRALLIHGQHLAVGDQRGGVCVVRSEEHTSELQSPCNL